MRSIYLLLITLLVSGYLIETKLTAPPEKLLNNEATSTQSTAVHTLAAHMKGKPKTQHTNTGQQTSDLDYRIAPADELHISVFYENDLDRKVLVNPTGGVSFPIVGDMQVSGHTISDVQNEIRMRLLRYVPDADVSVSVEKINGYTLFVYGEVNNPGRFSPGRVLDVVQSLTLAGGTTVNANENNIEILRRQFDEQIIFQFNLQDIKHGNKLQQNILLKSGDVVMVSKRSHSISSYPSPH